MSGFGNLELVTSVDLNYTSTKNGKTVYHFLYGSQLYGTLFGVFGKFIEKKPPEGASYVIDGLSLKLLNYQGTLNIGFTYHDLFYDDGENIYFGVRGASTCDEKSFKFPKPITVEKNGRFPLVFNRILYPLPDFEFRVEGRGAVNPAEPLAAEIPQSIYFDSEFQYRSGTGYYNHVLRPGMVGYDGLSIESLLDSMPYPSGRCHKSNVNIYF